MTDKTMPADKAREIIGGMRESMRRAEGDGTSPKFMGSMLVYVAALEALLPPPPRPTLAGMTREERAGCRWMQADVKDRGGRYVIATPSDRNGLAGLVSAYGGIEWTYPERVTPRPDLPRMEWPGTGQGAEDAATAKAGTLIESAADPRLAALPVGTILRDCDGEEVVKRGGDWAGLGYIPRESEGTEFGPWTVLHTGQKADTSDAVPPNTLAEGSVWDDAGALARACRESGRDQIIALDYPGDAYVWSEAAEWWESVPPMSMNGPFTILHTGHEEDQ